MSIKRKIERILRRDEVPKSGIPVVVPFDTFNWTDEKLKLDFSNYPTVPKWGGRAEINPNLSLQCWFDRDTKTWKPLDATTIASVQNYFKFLPTDPTPLGTAQWTEARVDSLKRLLLSDEGGLTPNKSLTDDTIKGILRTLGDAGASPVNVTGATLLSLVDDIITNTNGLEDNTIKGLLRSIGDAGTTPTDAPNKTVLAHLAAIAQNTIAPYSRMLNGGFEWGSVFNWFFSSSTGVIDTTTILTGSFSAKVTIAANTTAEVRNTTYILCRENQVLLPIAYINRDANVTQVRIGIRCFDENWAYLSTVYGAPITTVAGQWSGAVRMLIPPANTRVCQIVLEIVTGGSPSTCYVDSFHLLDRLPEQRNIQQWGGTELTGMDITQILARTKEETIIYEDANKTVSAISTPEIDINNESVTIESLELSTDDKDTEINIVPRDNTGTLAPNAIRFPSLTGTSLQPITPANIDLYTSEIFKNMLYDVPNNRYRVALTRKLDFAHGFLLYVQNMGVPTSVVAYCCVVKKYPKTV